MLMQCLICKGIVLQNELTKTCEACNYIFHLECWTENGGCGTAGCKNLPKLEKKNYSAKKICPACSESIDLSDLVCPFCREQFDSVVPLTADEFKNVPQQEPKSNTEGRKAAILILIFGLLGITAPATLIFGGIWYNNNRIKLKDNNPLFNIVAILGLSISAFISLLILISILNT